MERLQAIGKYFDNIARSKAVLTWYSDSSWNDVYQSFLNLLPVHPHILDVGCGTGCEAYHLSQLGAKVTGIDCSEESVCYARKNNPDTNSFIVGDYTKLCSYVNSGAFDGAVAILTWNYISANQLLETIRQLSLCLRSEAYIFFLLQLGDGLEKQKSKWFCHEKNSFWLYKHSYDLLDLFLLQNEFVMIREVALPEHYHQDDYHGYIYKRR